VWHSPAEPWRLRWAGVSERELATGEWAVLALLVAEPGHGWTLVRELAPDGEVGRIWSLPRPLVYRALETLRARSLVEDAGTVASVAGPRRTIVKPTPAGRRALREWLAEPVAHVRDLRSLLLLKLFFCDRLGIDASALLEAQRALVQRIAAAQSEQLEASSGFAQLLALWRSESTEAALRFIDGAFELSGAPGAHSRK
jgi:DNA-binding PadR family transcriptional regulator